MQTPMQTKSRSVLGVTDLTLVAPLKQALIPALDARSYESRLRLLLRTLGTLRMSSLEAEETPLIEDAIHRIRALQSFRVAITGKDVVLAVAFDGGWEPYMRRIWRDLGPLLDVIFCNCEGYLLSYDHSFAEYTDWVRSAQVDTGLFYNASNLSVSDLHYLREAERYRIDQISAPAPMPVAPREYLRQSMPPLVALYRLSDMYLPGTPDGACLLRAALYLLPALPSAAGALQKPHAMQASEYAALSWFVQAQSFFPKKLPDAVFDPVKVQGGIIDPYVDLTHACLLLIELHDAKAAGALLDYLGPKVTRASAQTSVGGAPALPYVNLGFTVQGLQMVGVQAGSLGQLPAEFQEGMAARAGTLGDWYHNHPTRWKLPARNWPSGVPGLEERVQLSSVHAIVQFACSRLPSRRWQELVGDPTHPLAKPIQDLEVNVGGKGVRILSVQAMQRFIDNAGSVPHDRFGFADGLSQPTIKAPPPGAGYSDQVRLGDLLLGYPNSLDDPPLTGPLWDDSTFLVIRKLRQDVEALNDALVQSKQAWDKHDDAKALMMGRRQDGTTLIPGAVGNSFDYKSDPHGALCPLQSHVRRANPRETRAGDMPTVPRIMRRGMSYGPGYSLLEHAAERGLVFMAYNASIAEQFEVIQSWLSGGNSGPNTYTALRDPLLGVRRDDDPHTYVCQSAGTPLRINLKTSKPFVQLEWGVYLFVPSIRALLELQNVAREATKIEAPATEDERKRKEDRRVLQRSIEAQRGAATIAGLRQAEQALGYDAAKKRWKIALEDVSARMSGVSQNIWTAIRELHKGALRTPYGVLVASKTLVMEVFDNGSGLYTATGYADRMRRSFGEIYLGMDDGPQYRRESVAANAAILSVTERQGFDSARLHMQAILNALTAAPGNPEVTVEAKDLIDDLLAKLSHEWFGIPDGNHIVSGGWHWKPNVPPACPGHFHSPSRYMFQPNPGAEATDTGEAHGQALAKAVLQLVEARRAPAAPGNPHIGLVAKALFNAIPKNDSLLASTLIGVMMGFLPTVDGNLRGTMYEWVNDQSLWDHQIAYLALNGRDAYTDARAALLPPLTRTLQLRPVPELTWRTAVTPHRLGSVDVLAGDRIVLAIVSATQQCRLDDDNDLYPLFGGQRKAVGHATHACPGYDMAMGVMLGALTALVETVNLRPTLSPMALKIHRRA